MLRISVVGLIVLIAVAGCTQTVSDPAQDDASVIDGDATGPQAADEVVMKRGGAPSNDDLVWVAWTDTDDGLAHVWRKFGQAAATRPDRGERPVVLVATIESTACPITILNVVVKSETLLLDLADSPKDRGCTADVKPITFVLSPQDDDLRPPFVVEFGGTLVQVPEADTVVAAPRREGDDWELLRPASLS